MSVWIDRCLSQASHYMGLCTTEAMFHRELKRMKIPCNKWPDFIHNEQSNATAHEFQEPSGKLCAIVCIRVPEGTTGIQVAALLVHEAVHVFDWHCASIGEKEPSSEYKAYGIQNIAQGLMMAYQQQTTGKP